MSNPKFTQTLSLPFQWKFEKPSKTILFLGLAVLLSVLGFFEIFALYIGIAIFITVGMIAAIKFYREIDSINFNDSKYEISLEEIINDLENTDA